MHALKPFVKLSMKGQAAVELAFTFPIVFLLIVTVFELGFAFNAFTTVTSAARQGAKAGAVYVFDPSASVSANDQNRESGTGTSTPYSGNVRDTVTSSLGALNTAAPYFDKNTSVTISYNPAAGTVDTRQGDLISVQVVYRYQFLTQVLSSATITLTGQATERIE